MSTPLNSDDTAPARPGGMTREQRVMRARVAALTRWSREDPGPAMARVRDARRDSMRDRVDPRRELTEAERERRVDALVQAEMTRLAYLSSRARSVRQ